LLRKAQILAYVRIRVGLALFLRLVSVVFEQNAGLVLKKQSVFLKNRGA